MLPDNQTLTELMKQASKGNESAFSELVKVFEKKVYNIAMQAVKNHADALDVSQEAFIKLWRTSSSYRGECSVASWVIKITRNTAFDLLRKRGAQKIDTLTLEDDEGGVSERDLPSSSEDDPVSSYERKEKIAAVRAAIGELGEEHREIILLRDIQGLSYADISDVLGLEVGTVKSRLNRARGSLKEILLKRNIF